MGLPTRDGMLAPNRARSRTARTETPGPLGQTHQIAIVRLVVLWACLVTASEASVVRLDSLGHTIARVDRSGGASSFELRASSFRPGTEQTDGRTDGETGTGTGTGRQTEDRKTAGLLLLLCAYFGRLPIFAQVETKKRTLLTPGPWRGLPGHRGCGIGSTARIMAGVEADMPLSKCPIYVVRRAHESAQSQEDPNEDPVMRLRWFWVADGERGRAGPGAQRRGPEIRSTLRAHTGGGETPSV